MTNIYHESLDFYYNRIEDHVKLVESYTEKEGISFLIRALRMKPYDLFSSNRNTFNIKLYRHWIDEFGNSLRIGNRKRIDILMNDLSIDRKLIGGTDIYHGLEFDDVIKISNFCAVTMGKDDDYGDDCYIFHFIGIDNYFRSFMVYNGEMIRIPTLKSSVKYLLSLVANKDIRYFKKQKYNKNIHYMEGSIKSFLFGLPIQRSVLLTIREADENLFDLLLRR